MNLGSLEIFLEINTGGRRVMWDFCLASQVTGLSTSFPVPMKRKNTISNVFLSRKIWWKEATKCVLKKQLFLKMSHNSQENTCSGHSDTGVFLWELKTKTVSWLIELFYPSEVNKLNIRKSRRRRRKDTPPSRKTHTMIFIYISLFSLWLFNCEAGGPFLYSVFCILIFAYLIVILNLAF